MVTIKEMIKDIPISDIEIKHQQNIQELLKRVNILRSAYELPFIVTSGYRTLQDHIRIYNQKGIFDRTKIPMKSSHLRGEAVDLADPNLLLTKWLKEDNSKRLIEVDLYAEEGNFNWVHLQLYPPKSGNRWFLP